MISRPIGENYAATLAEPIRREAAAGACFSFSQVVTSSGSKRTDPEMRNDGMLPLAAILYMFHCQKQEATLTLLQVKRTRPLHLHLILDSGESQSVRYVPGQCTMCAAPHRPPGPGPSIRSQCRCFCSLPDQGTVRRSQNR